MSDFYERKPRKTYDKKTAQLKAADFCAYQERSQQQVRDKLYTYGLHYDEVEEVLTNLIVEDFINEERFAKAYVGGKFRMKGWGRRKIMQGLKQHKVSEYCIKKGMQVIEPEDYYNTLLKHADKKFESLKTESEYIIKGKLTQHLVGKGFEMELIRDAIDDVFHNRLS